MVSLISSIKPTIYSSSSQALSPATKARLESLGIDTSNIKSEIEGQTTLKSVVQSKSSQKSQSVQDSENASTQMSAPPSGSEPAWISSMKELGITPTGSKEGDVAAIKSAISQMEPAQAKSVASTFQNLGLSVSSPDSEDQKAKGNQIDYFVGATQAAELNKLFHKIQVA